MISKSFCALLLYFPHQTSIFIDVALHFLSNTHTFLSLKIFSSNVSNFRKQRGGKKKRERKMENSFSQDHRKVSSVARDPSVLRARSESRRNVSSTPSTATKGWVGGGNPEHCRSCGALSALTCGCNSIVLTTTSSSTTTSRAPADLLTRQQNLQLLESRALFF